MVKRLLASICCVGMVASACSSGPSATAEAKLACKTYLPGFDAKGSITFHGMHDKLLRRDAR